MGRDHPVQLFGVIQYSYLVSDGLVLWSDCVTACSTSMTDWLTDWLTNWPTDWLTGWLGDCLGDWLGDWINEVLHSSLMKTFSMNQFYCVKMESPRKLSWLLVLNWQATIDTVITWHHLETVVCLSVLHRKGRLKLAAPNSVLVAELWMLAVVGEP